MWPTVTDRRPVMAVLVALVALAWLNLWVWGQSPSGRFLSHEELGEAGVGLDAHALGLAAAFLAGWTLMTVAMMLPTSLPLLALFHRLTRQRPDRSRLVGLVIAGYLGVWTLFGALTHLVDQVVHTLVERSAWLGEHAWGLGAGTIVLAGLYQFSPLKHRCREQCRSPLSFIAAHWQGSRESTQALRLGVHHGLFCLGCCWSLMLLMFAVGVGNLGWMLTLGAIMGIEKNLPWGRRLSAPVGLALLAWGLVEIGLRAG